MLSRKTLSRLLVVGLSLSLAISAKPRPAEAALPKPVQALLANIGLLSGTGGTAPPATPTSQDNTPVAAAAAPAAPPAIPPVPHRRLTADEKQALWRDVFAQLEASPRVIFHEDVRKIPSYPGFIASNEPTISTTEAPEGPSDLYLGFGTTTNFNLIAMRRPHAFVLADQHPEVVATLHSFWRTLFIVAKTPAEWLAILAGLDPRQDTVEQVFKRIAARETADPSLLDQLDQRLIQAVKAGHISQVDRRFTMAVIEQFINPPLDTGDSMEMQLYRAGFTQDLPKRDTLFANVYGDNGLASWLRGMYDPQAMLAPSAFANPEMKEEVRRVFHATSFLFNPEHFQFLQNMFLAGQDYYAQADITNPHFWVEAGAFATARGQTYSDVYTTNILPLIESMEMQRGTAKYRGWTNFYLAQATSQLPGAESLWVYQTDLDEPHPFTISQLVPASEVQRVMKASHLPDFFLDHLKTSPPGHSKVPCSGRLAPPSRKAS